MDIFLETIMSFPAVILTALLIVVLIYWSLILIGAFDLDMHFDFHDHFDIGDFFGAAGLAHTPFPIIFSILILCSWMLATMGTYYLVLLIPFYLWKILVGTVVFIVSLWISTHLTAKIIRPLQRFFRSHEVRSRHQLVGKICVILTSRVDEKFGQGIYNEGGTELILFVRANTPNTLTKGSKALIVSYDEVNGTYTVTSYDDFTQ